MSCTPTRSCILHCWRITRTSDRLFHYNQCWRKCKDHLNVCNNSPMAIKVSSRMIRRQIKYTRTVNITIMLLSVWYVPGIEEAAILHQQHRRCHPSGRPRNKSLPRPLPVAAVYYGVGVSTQRRFQYTGMSCSLELYQ